MIWVTHIMKTTLEIDDRLLARAKRHRLHQPVALVEDPENGDSLSHWRHPGLMAGQYLVAARGRGLLLLLVRGLRAAGREQKRGAEKHSLAEHVYSGVQGW